MSTILCIDDDLSLLEAQRSLLEEKGHRVLIAPDGAIGIEMIRNYSVDAVILDLDMHGKDGVQVADVFMNEQPNLPVAIYGGSLYDIPESLKWFADALVQKGDGPEALLLAVEKLVTDRGTAKKFSSRGTARASEQLSA